MSGLPDFIPLQTVPIAQEAQDGELYAEFNWYLFFYNLAIQVLSSGGSTPASGFDILDSVDLDAAGADVPQAYRQIVNETILAALDVDVAAADVADLRRRDANVQLLLPELEVTPTLRDMANALLLAQDQLLPDVQSVFGRSGAVGGIPGAAGQMLLSTGPGANPAFGNNPTISGSPISATTLVSTGNGKVIANTVGPQSIPSGTITTITTWTKSLDQTSSFNASTGVFTVPVAGTYMVTIQLRLDSVTWAAGNLFQIVLQHNGSTAQLGIKTLITAGAYSVDDHLTFLVNCAASDTLSIALFHNGTGTGGIDTNANINNLGIIQVP
jgi:hypothetical protein